MCLPNVIGSLFRITSLAEDVKLSACGRHPSLCFIFSICVYRSNFRGAFFYASPKLTHSLGFVNPVTLWAMWHFKFRGGVDLCVIIFNKKRKNLPCTVWSTVPCTFDHRHGPAFKLTCVCSSAETHFTHTLSTHAIERMYIRSIACVLSPHVTFLGHFPPFPLHFFSLNKHLPISALTPPTRAQPYHSPSHHPINTTAPPCHHPSPSSPSPSLRFHPHFPIFLSLT